MLLMIIGMLLLAGLSLVAFVSICGPDNNSFGGGVLLGLFGALLAIVVLSIGGDKYEHIKLVKERYPGYKIVDSNVIGDHFTIVKGSTAKELFITEVIEEQW